MDLFTQVQERELDTETETADLQVDKQLPTVTQTRKLRIEHKIGDLFSSPYNEPLAHCISADCAFGAGIARQFRKRYGVEKVEIQRKQPGQCALTKEGDRFVFHLVTKKWATDKPTYEDLEGSLKDMKYWVCFFRLSSVSVPRLGCGLDGLDFTRVLQIITEVFSRIDMLITIYSLC